MRNPGESCCNDLGFSLRSALGTGLKFLGFGVRLEDSVCAVGMQVFEFPDLPKSLN